MNDDHIINDYNKYAWEHTKENIFPLETGRKDIKMLNNTIINQELNKIQINKDKTQEQIQYEQEIINYNGLDPLYPWIKYIKWIREVRYSNGNTTYLMQVLESCLLHFRNDQRYQNDERFIKIWIQYADASGQPKQIFDFMYRHHIGRKVALFYIAWATVAEMGKNYKKTDLILTKAKTMNAKPEAAIETRQRQFERRMRRLWINKNQVNENSHMDSHVRNVLGNLSEESSRSSLRISTTEKYGLTNEGDTAYDRSRRLANSIMDRYSDVYVDPEDEEDAELFDFPDQFYGKESTVKNWIPDIDDKENAAPVTKLQVGSLLENNSTRNEIMNPVAHQNGGILCERTNSIPTERERIINNPLKNLSNNNHNGNYEIFKRDSYKNVNSNMKNVKLSFNENLLIGEDQEVLSFEEVRAKHFRVLSSNLLKSWQMSSNITSKSSSNELLVNRKLSFNMTSASNNSNKDPSATMISSRNNDNDDDVTVNTRVAQQTIDQMFYSPSPEKDCETTWNNNPRKDVMVVPMVEKPIVRTLHFTPSPSPYVSNNGNDELHTIDSSSDDNMCDYQKLDDEDMTVYKDADWYSEQPNQNSDIFTNKLRKPLNDIVVTKKKTNKEMMDEISSMSRNNKQEKVFEETIKRKNEGEIRYYFKKTKRNHCDQLYKVGIDKRIQDNIRINIMGKFFRLLDPFRYKHRVKILENNIREIIAQQRDNNTKNIFVYHEKLKSIFATNNRKQCSFLIESICCTRENAYNICQEHKLKCLIGKKIGSGTFAAVYSCQVNHQDSPNEYAIKYEKIARYLPWEYQVILNIKTRLSKLNETKDKENDHNDDLELKCNPYPTIKIHSLHIYPNASLLIMEKSNIGTLNDLIHKYMKAGKTMSEEMVIYYTIQMLSMIRQLHSVGILHADIKPDNWLLVPSMFFFGSKKDTDPAIFASGSLKLIDFGRAIDMKVYSGGQRSKYVSPDPIKSNNNHSCSHDNEYKSIINGNRKFANLFSESDNATSYEKNEVTPAMENNLKENGDKLRETCNYMHKTNGILFIGDCHAKSFQCVEMRNNLPWTNQIDLFGICATTHCLLFGAYISLCSYDTMDYQYVEKTGDFLDHHSKNTVTTDLLYKRKKRTKLNKNDVDSCKKPRQNKIKGRKSLDKDQQCCSEIYNIFKNKNKKWFIKRPFKRYWQTDLWTFFFDSLLNIDNISNASLVNNDCTGIDNNNPKLSVLQSKFEEFLYQKESRMIALQDQLRKQDLFFS